MDEQKLKALLIDVVENHFCCMGSECEAGHCRARLIRLENRLEEFMQYAARKLNRISRKLEITDEETP